MLKRLTASVCVITALASGSASACDIKNFPFGVSGADLRKQYDFNSLEFSTIGRDEMLLRATALCKGLPRSIQLRTVFFDNHLVSVIFEDFAASGELRKLAEDQLGKLDKAPQVDKQGDRFFDQTFAMDNDRVALYSYRASKGEPMEYLELTTTTQLEALNSFARKNGETPAPKNEEEGGITPPSEEKPNNEIKGEDKQ